MNGFSVLGSVFSPFFVAIGFLMRKYDFSVMFKSFKDPDSLHVGLGVRRNKIAAATPENIKKYSKRLGNVFIVCGLICGFICVPIAVKYFLR